MRLLWQHWLLILVVLFVGYWLGGKYPGKLAGLPLVGGLLG